MSTNEYIEVEFLYEWMGRKPGTKSKMISTMVEELEKRTPSPIKILTEKKEVVVEQKVEKKEVVVEKKEKVEVVEKPLKKETKKSNKTKSGTTTK